MDDSKHLSNSVDVPEVFCCPRFSAENFFHLPFPKLTYLATTIDQFQDIQNSSVDMYKYIYTYLSLFCKKMMVKLNEIHTSSHLIVRFFEHLLLCGSLDEAGCSHQISHSGCHLCSSCRIGLGTQLTN